MAQRVDVGELRRLEDTLVAVRGVDVGVHLLLAVAARRARGAVVADDAAHGRAADVEERRVGDEDRDRVGRDLQRHEQVVDPRRQPHVVHERVVALRDCPDEVESLWRRDVDLLHGVDRRRGERRVVAGVRAARLPEHRLLHGVAVLRRDRRPLLVAERAEAGHVRVAEDGEVGRAEDRRPDDGGDAAAAAQNAAEAGPEAEVDRDDHRLDGRALRRCRRVGAHHRERIGDASRRVRPAPARNRRRRRRDRAAGVAREVGLALHLGEVDEGRVAGRAGIAQRAAGEGERRRDEGDKGCWAARHLLHALSTSRPGSVSLVRWER